MNRFGPSSKLGTLSGSFQARWIRTNISRKVATIRRTSCIRFKQMNTDDLVSHPRPEDNFNINDCQNDYCRDWSNNVNRRRLQYFDWPIPVFIRFYWGRSRVYRNIYVCSKTMSGSYIYDVVWCGLEMIENKQKKLLYVVTNYSSSRLLKNQYPVTAHAPNFDFLTGCREFKRRKKWYRTFKNPFASCSV